MKMVITQAIKKSSDQKYKIVILAVCFVLLVVSFGYLLPEAIDWHGFYRPATIAMLQGRSPFEVDKYFNAPWVLIPFMALAGLPENISRGILTVACLASVIIVARKFGAKPVTIMFLLLSPPVVQLVIDGNIDWLVLLGFIFPPQIGLFFIAAKPQIGIGVVIFWLIQSYRKGGFREIFRVFAPVSVAFILSIIIYGFWPMNYREAVFLGGNSSLWPVSLPIGLVLLFRALKKREINFAVAASPCLTPYLLLHSYIGLFISFCKETTETIIAVIGLWIVVIIRGFGY